MQQPSELPANAFAGEAPGVLFGLPMPMARAFGLRGEAIGNDQARVRMQHNTDYTNSRGDVHGGAIATLLDCALSCAARSHDPARYGVVTVDLTVHFIAPGRGDVIGLGFCERRGRALSFVRGEVRDEAGELLALATGTFKLVERAA
ncbi:phenylacetic acid degradation-like protein [Cupriavidus sp. USMAA2-4]|uniref:Phenylacetic acid degradation-like protein n=1 Tax=Cupriavidus malaysiensis TaxID=367825 RepID=A0ABN4TVE0_9BURK|nr:MULTISPECIES: PaaI family thioesterase [Cupriavidus]AOY95183.1 phenylacetic acid degradation-like protein [Cupriavidus sp. USMAA2-4]AOZ01918.1 phenylacetic acid degradation-like protein [Cupriavidus sp. USMAHM13]AOZ08344.1 phenylacetic acid degradation-like protein [Cupriavidus malaysiensis]